ncbi:hypothetical protein BDV93DRAFT_331855 [Ceratobasidium sp. AG-I]|nr:hypothetical protein BDV93DRAFT_331855 [Ceratobasidium sp. AG-I]
MLAKEWLVAYNTCRPRPPREYAVLRQSRLSGLTDWGVLHIIDLLSSLLDLALLLFSLGLVVYLWTLNLGIAITLAVIAGLMVVFYVATTFLGAFNKFCPFVTHMSKFVHSAFKPQTGQTSQEDKSTESFTTDDDLRALSWLAEYARDPAVRCCSYQALAGLSLKNSHESQPGGLGADAATSNQYQMVQGFFQALCQRFPKMLNYPREVAACQGMNVARYANALPELVKYLETYANQQLISNEGSGELKSSPEQDAFEALDAFKHSGYPLLSSDSSALLTSAELRLTRLASDRLNQTSSSTGGYVKVDMNATGCLLTDSDISLSDLRTRYSKAHARAGSLFRDHADGHTPISTNALIHLLNSIRDGATRSEGLCGDSSCSVDGLNGLFTGLLRLLASVGVHDAPNLDAVVEETLRAITANSRKKSAAGAIQESIIFAALEVSRTECDGIARPAEEAMRTLYERLETYPERQKACSAFDTQVDLMVELVSVVDQHLSRLGRSTLKLFVNLFLLHYDSQTFFSRLTPLFNREPWNTISVFLRILAEVPIEVSELNTLLTDLARHVESKSYLPFFALHDGFSALLKIGEHSEYHSTVAKCVTCIIKNLATVGQLVAGTKAVPELFNAVAFIMEIPPFDDEGLGYLLASLHKILPQSKDLSKDLTEVIAKHPTTSIIHRTLKEKAGIFDQQADFLAYLEDIERA